ncbi:thioredoxin family protein [Candidatus Parcubacteria bacterium]|nr:thioredoxin family protein [Candidatus Parcubacteria bacterium]
MNNKKLNKFLSIALFFSFFISVFSFQATAANEVDLYFFWGDGCSYCSNAKPFLEKLKIEYPNLNIKSYEIYNNEDNRKLFAALSDAYAEDIRGVPAFFIGNDGFAGYAGSMDNHIRQLVENCLINNCESPIERLNKKVAAANINNQINNQNKKIDDDERLRLENEFIKSAAIDYVKSSESVSFWDKPMFVFLSKLAIALSAVFIFFIIMKKRKK